MDNTKLTMNKKTNRDLLKRELLNKKKVLKNDQGKNCQLHKCI